MGGAHTAEAHANGVVAGAEPGVRAGDSAKPASWRSARRRFPASAPAPASRCELQDRSGGHAGLPGGSRRSASWRRRGSGRRSAGSTRSIAPTVPQIYADIDRSKVLEVGRAVERRQHDARRAARQLYVNDFNRFGRVYKVYVQAEPEFRRDPKQLGLFFVRNQTGGMVPLDTLVTTRSGRGPRVHQPLQSVPHRGGHRRARCRLSRRRRRSTRSSRRRARCCRRT